MGISRALYRVLIRLCPPDLRAEFGPAMESLFVADLTRARGLAKSAVWARTVADVVRHGLGARRDAWRRFRSTSAYVEYEAGRWWMDTWRYDLRHAVRTMSREPATTGIIVLTLALAIGANTAVFSAVHSVLLRPLPFSQPDAIVMVWEKRPAEGVMNNVVSPADYLDWARLNQSFASIAAYSDDGADLTGAGDPERVIIGGVTAAYFDVLGLQPLHGRTFRPGDDVLGQHRVVVLSHAIWQQRFGGDRGIIGRTITLNDLPQQVIGVLRPDGRVPHSEPQIFAPMVLQGGPQPPARASHFLSVYARLKPGVSFEAARAELDRIGRDLEAEFPNLSRGHGAHVVRLDEQIRQPLRSMLLILMAAVAFVLLIACINVTNLLLAQAAGRRREMAVRTAIGAGRGRLARQAIVETGLLAAIGSAAGLLIAVAGVRVLAARLPAVVRPDADIVLSAPILLFTMAICLVSALLAGGLPAWQIVRDDPAPSLKEGGRSPVALRRGLRFGLIVSEVALTTLLLVGAGLTMRSFQQVLAQEAGVELDDRLTFRVGLPRSRYGDADAVIRFVNDLQVRLAGESVVTRAGATNALPMSGNDGRRGVVIENREVGSADGPTRAHPRGVTDGYLAAAGARLVEGRPFTSSDSARALKVAIVNETMARRYWPGRSAVGGRVRFTDQQDWREVVGVIADVRHWGLDAPVNPELYLPFEQYPSASMTFVMAGDVGPLALVAIARRHVRELDANLPLFALRTFEEVTARSTEGRRFTMVLLAAFAVLALMLAAAGIYGVMAHLVSLRTPEIGIRLTLGARPGGVMRQVLAEAAVQTGIGLMIGLAASLAMMRGMRTILFGIEPTDPLTLVSVAAALVVVALLAVTVPARRAMRVDPVIALRGE